MRLTLSLLAATIAAALAAAPAQAFAGHIFLGSFNGSEIGALFSHPTGVAVDNSAPATAGNVFVVDGGNHEQVDVLGPEGEAPAGVASPFQITHSFHFEYEKSSLAIDNSGGPSNGDLYVADFRHGLVKKFKLNALTEDYEYVCVITGYGGGCSAGGGTPTEAFNETSGVAVDSNGNVYVSDFHHEVIDEFNQAGGDVQQIKGPSTPGPLGRPGFLALGPQGDLFVQQDYYGQVLRFAANGSGEIEPAEAPTVFDSEESAGVAVDQSTGTVYVAHPHHVSQYSSIGTFEEEFGQGPIGKSLGIAVNSETGVVYVSDDPNAVNAQFVRAFSPHVTAADVTTGSASPLGVETVTLRGTVNPLGIQVSGCEFRWGTTTSYGHSAPCLNEANEADIGAGSEPVAVHADIEGLPAGTVHHVRLYAGNVASVFKNYGEDETFHTRGAPIVDAESSEGITKLTATLKAQVNPDGLETTYHFDYIAEGADYQEHGFEHAAKAPLSDASLGSAQGDQLASQPIAGLAAGTTYHYRVVADNSYSAAHGGPVTGAPQEFTTVPYAGIDKTSVSGITSSSADLEALVNPLGEDTTYHFDYVDDAHFQSEGGFASNATERIPQPDADLGSEFADQPAFQHISGLSPATVYHYRVVVDNAAAEANGGPVRGPERTFTTLNSDGTIVLSDNRVWEQVSPTEKTGGIGGVFPLGELTHSLEQFGRPLQSSLEGNSMAYLGEDFYQPALGNLNFYLSQRSAQGWATQNLTREVASTSESALETNLDVAFSPDLSTGIVSGVTPLSEGALGGYTNLYVDQGRGLEPLLTVKPPNRTPDTFGYGSHTGAPTERNLRFAGANSGSATAPAFSRILFEANDALTQNAVDGGENANNLYEWSGGALHLVNVLPGGGGADPNATFGANYDDIYNTVLRPSLSQAISADGSRIFWTDQNDHNLYVRLNADQAQSPLKEGKCTIPTRGCTVQVDAGAGGGGAYQSASVDGSLIFFTKGGHLYRYDLGSGETTDLTAVASPSVLGFVGASADGAYTYFVAAGALAGENAEGQSPQPGQPNLYLSHAGASSFIATLAPEDNEIPTFYGTNSPYGDWFRTFAGRTARVSPNGRYLAFVSRESLTGYDNATGPAKTCLVSGGVCNEAFIYDAQSAHLACPSCNVDGSRPTADTWLPAPINGTYQQRYLNDAGQLFFSTDEAVVPEDTNITSDVYEYEGGHVHRISPGDSEDEAVFADASESGNDVFFTTRERLVPDDKDSIVDLYDARVNGTHPAPPPPPPCSGEEDCRAPLSPPPAAQSAGSASFVGPPSETPKHHSQKRHHKKRGRHHKRAAGHNRGGKR